VAQLKTTDRALGYIAQSQIESRNRISMGITTFPYLWMWQAYCGSQGYPFYSRNYNVAIEPYSVPIETLSESISRGHAHQIRAGGKAHTSFLFSFTQGTQAIKYIGLDGEFTYEKLNYSHNSLIPC